MATTSGTVGATQLNVTSIIEHAFRRCGKLASTVSSELQLSAQENLYLLLSDLANRGISLWCVNKVVLGTAADNALYNLPVGTVDVLDVLYRTNTALTGDAVTGAGYSGIDLTTAAVVNNASIKFTGATTATLVIDSSDDGTTWTQRQAFPAATTVPALQWICCDIDSAVSARFWRVRDTSGTLASVTEITFSNTPNELPIGVLNRDDYSSFPNKTFTASKALNYWFDKQITPRLWLWPVPNTSSDQIVVWNQRQIQDVGSLSGLLEIPQRWQESIIFSLACRVALEIPPGELPPGRLEFLENKAEYHLNRAEDGESDGSPIKLAPNVRGYTR